MTALALSLDFLLRLRATVAGYNPPAKVNSQKHSSFTTAEIYCIVDLKLWLCRVSLW